MCRDSKLHDKLIENALSQAGQPSEKNAIPYWDPEKKIKEIHESVENLRKKHENLLGK